MSRSRTLVCLASLALAMAFVSPGVAAARQASPPAPVVGGPMVRVSPGPGQLRALVTGATQFSGNWSGYAAFAGDIDSPDDGTVSDVKGTWVVPTATGGVFDAFCSDWVGIDGFASGSVEQLGTVAEWYEGTASYYAWWEMFPAGETKIDTSEMNVHPGDTISAEVQSLGGNTFHLSMTDVPADHSATQTFDTTQTVAPQDVTTAQRNSAEWVHEAPGGEIGPLPLAKTTPVDFTNCYATINGTTGPIESASWTNVPIDLVSMTTVPVNLATPSVLTGDGTGFTVDYTSGKYPGLIDIFASPTSVKRPKPFVLDGLMFPGALHDPCVVYVKKPGSGRWSYSSNRLAFDALDGYSVWWYRYTPKLKGTYQFYVKFAGDVDRFAATSKTIKVVVK